jgi:hypothetical protein
MDRMTDHRNVYAARTIVQLLGGESWMNRPLSRIER